MSPTTADVLEWHIFEIPNHESTPGKPPLHMGPFATEVECRAVLEKLQKVPEFQHGRLEVIHDARRREKRIRIKLAIEISRLVTPREAWPAHTVDISLRGARLLSPPKSLSLGEFVNVRYGPSEAVFRVVWVGVPGSATDGQAGVECLSPESNIWDLDLSARTDDGPLLQEIVVARAVQRRFFPREKPRLRTLDYSGKCVQARTVGGDYYDFLDLGEGRVGFVLADVSGKGVAAALLMANLQGSIHNQAGTSSRDIPALLAAVNSHLFEHTDPHRYTTLFLGCYDDESRSLTYVNCGHNPPLVLRRDGAVEHLEATATVLGLFPDWQCRVEETQIHPGDLVSIYTDGITETTASNGDEFGEVRLLAELSQSRQMESAAIVQRIEHAVEAFRDSTHLQDDLTLVVARAR